MKLWAGRFQKETDTLVNNFNSSITLRRPPVQAGHRRLHRPRHHAGQAGHHRAGRMRIRSSSGLKGILADLLQAGCCRFDHGQRRHPHESSRRMLTQRIGDAGKRLHTARSRNDQVAVDFRLTYG